MMQPPKPPPVIRAPRAPEARAVSTARSTCGTVISKSSRIDACEASRRGARSVRRPARSTLTASSTRAFSVTTWRTRRWITGSGSWSRAASRSVTSRNAGTPSSRAASSQLARRAAYSLSTSAWGVLVSRTRISSPALGGVETNLLSVVSPAVEEERVPGGAQGGGGLVHQTCRGPDERILRAPRQLGTLQSGDVEVVEVGEGTKHGTLQCGR